MKIVAVTQARMGSSRLPGKVMMQAGGKPLLEIHLTRLLRSKRTDKLIVATTTLPQDDIIVALAERMDVAVFRGSEHDVLDRYYHATRNLNADYIVRITADCPLIDPELMDEIIDFTVSQGLDYGSNTLEPTFPNGVDVEVIKFSALAKAWQEATLSSDREHVAPYIWRNSTFKEGTFFRSNNFISLLNYSNLRFTVDYLEDYELIKVLVDKVGDFSWHQHAQYLKNNSDVARLNSNCHRNAGYIASLKADTF